MHQQNTARKILVIDDEPRLLIGLEAVLKRAGYEVLAAKNGLSGVLLARQHHPDIIVCDVMMPSPNGFEVRERLLDSPDTADIPFIFLTARTGHADRMQGLNLKADDYVTKPFQRDELLVRIEAVLRRIQTGRTQGLAEMERHLQELRTQMTENLSHELRTPLQAIIPTLESALAGEFDSEAEEQQFMESALFYSRHLRRLIDDVLFMDHLDLGDVSRLRTEIDIQTDFVRVVEETVDLWTARPLSGKQLSLRLVVEPDVRLSAPRLEFVRAVSHLVDNACKFSPPGGRILVHLGPYDEGGCILTVVNDGPQIPDDLRDKVFEPYFQASQGTTRLYNGLGVGLTIARAVARSLGGDVTILDSTHGSQVRMVIPPDHQTSP